MSITILLSVWSASKDSRKGDGCHEANDHSLGNGCALSGRLCSCTDQRFDSVCNCASIVLVFLGSVCSAVVIGGGRPLCSFDELLSMLVLTASWWMPLMVDLRQVLMSGSSARYCWMLDLNRPIRDRRRPGRSSGGLWQS